MSIFGGLDNELCCTTSTGNLSLIEDYILYLSQSIHVQCHCIAHLNRTYIVSTR